MKKWNFEPEKVAQAIAELNLSARKKLIMELSINSVLMRHQWKWYASAINFTAPQDAKKCGRYNPLGGEIAVWYASDAALTGMAESYGRTYQLNSVTVYPEKVLAEHYICSVDVIRPIRVLDVVGICQLLHIPLDSLESEDYTFPQWLMKHLYTNYGEEFDGIVYDSRHYRHKKCFAFWHKPERDMPFKDTSEGMVSVSEYREYDKTIFPADWETSYMSGEDILEELLNFKITPEPH